MLNKITGWLIFSQLAYVSLVVVVSVINSATNNGIVRLLAPIRESVGLSNRHISLSSYISHPLAYTSLVNMGLMLVFFWKLLRRGNEIDYSKGFFNVMNAVYVVASSWIFMTVICNIID